MPHSKPDEPNEDLAPVVADLRSFVARLEATVTQLNDTVAARDARIAELERQLGEARRSGKRQAAPFSKGAPDDEPARPGCKPGDAHGRHGHRMSPATKPDRELDAPLPECCRTAVAESTTSETPTSASSTCSRSA